MPDSKKSKFKKRHRKTAHMPADVDPAAHQEGNLLLKLPLELRHEIYVHLFSNTRLLSGFRYVEDDCILRIVPAPNALTLLHTCRQFNLKIGKTWLGLVLFYFENPPDMMDKLTSLHPGIRSMIRYICVGGSPKRPHGWRGALQSRGGFHSSSSVTIYRSTQPQHYGAILNKDSRVEFEQDFPSKGSVRTYGDTEDAELMATGEREKEVLVVVKRGKGIDYEEKQGSAYHQYHDIREEYPGKSWEDIMLQDMKIGLRSEAAWNAEDWEGEEELPLFNEAVWLFEQGGQHFGEDEAYLNDTCREILEELKHEVEVDKYTYVDEYVWRL
ncbi:hypothetical protein PT974_10833 [Cladobotryum mycophilum]|uniref:F-box domain-containing protein n=1 Tax=Cladobotryum mycophilum TaxID=491253 RepID=A0ABR0SAZ8_9HYPO